MLRDMKTMCENARRYNRLGSQIHNDSYIVESVAGGSMQMHTINSPYRQSGKDWIEQFSAMYVDSNPYHHNNNCCGEEPVNKKF
jgi:hypothetical protein